MSIRFTNCIILATDENGEFETIKDQVLCTGDDLIEYIGPVEGAPETDMVKDMGGAVLMPGLVNAHGHGPMTLLRGIGGDLLFRNGLKRLSSL